MTTFIFDMDGTIADLYGQEGWLDDLISESPAPYINAKPMCNFSRLARLLNTAQAKGCRIEIISWLSRDSSEAYEKAVAEAKRKWLNNHLNSVTFDAIHIVKYGTPKSKVTEATEEAILFDDEERNREEWLRSGKGFAFTPDKIFEILSRV